MMTTGIPGLARVSAAGVVETNLEVVGRSDLDAPGLFGDVTVVGTTAVVLYDADPLPGSPCPTSAAAVVDIKDPRQPRVVASIPFPPGMTAVDVESSTVLTPTFTGDLVALALAPLPGLDGSCAEAGREVIALHDVTDPARPRFLGQTTGCRRCGPGPFSVSLAPRADGRVLAATVDDAGTAVAFHDVTDPVRPAALGQWVDPAPQAGGRCAAVTGDGKGGVLLYEEGERALVVSSDGRVYDLDLSEPARPSAGGDPAPPAGGAVSAHAAVLPLGNRTIAILSEEACADAPPPPGLRILALDPEAPPRELEPVRFPGAAPGRLVGSGGLAYVAWHGAGVRVIDFGEVRARTVAQFIPAQPDVVGVALLPEHIVVTDLTSGLYVLERPDEGGGRASFWSQFLSLLPYLGFAAVATAAFVVPRLAMGRARVGAGSPMPAPEGVRRRRA